MTEKKANGQLTFLTTNIVKTRNIYEMKPAAYSKLLTENVTNIYKHAEEGTVNAINDELMQLVSELDISGRVDRKSKNPAFITLKDRKPNFENHPSVDLSTLRKALSEK